MPDTQTKVIKSQTTVFKTPVFKCSWTEEEKELYIKLLRKYGRDYQKFNPRFPSKTPEQIRNFWMNNKYKGLALLDMMARWEKAREDKHGFKEKKMKRRFKGKRLVLQIENQSQKATNSNSYEKSSASSVRRTVI